MPNPDKVCPTCGTCPTCGSKGNNFTIDWSKFQLPNATPNPWITLPALDSGVICSSTLDTSAQP